MRVYKRKKKGKEIELYSYDFTSRGERYRGSTGETNKARADSIAALVLADVVKTGDPLPRKAPLVSEVFGRFSRWVDNDQDLSFKSKEYYRNGLRLLSATTITGMRLDLISSEAVAALDIGGSPSNVNNARRTLSRLLHKAEGWHLIRRAPIIVLQKEKERKLQLDEIAEAKLLKAAALLGWKQNDTDLFEDILILMRDGGFRNEKELYPMRIEALDWDRIMMQVIDSKTPTGEREVPMSNRAVAALKRRAGGRSEGWLFPSKRSESGHLTTFAKRFREARSKAGLPASLVLYCGRHNYGTRLLKKTGDLKLVMETMGHIDVKSAMKYQHPDINDAGRAINESNETGDIAKKRAEA
jgi:hypothetical protein